MPVFFLATGPPWAAPPSRGGREAEVGPEFSIHQAFLSIQTQRTAGSLENYAREWERIQGIPAEILRIVRRGHEIRFESKPPRRTGVVRSRMMGPVKDRVLMEGVQNRLELSAI